MIRSFLKYLFVQFLFYPILLIASPSDPQTDGVSSSLENQEIPVILDAENVFYDQKKKQYKASGKVKIFYQKRELSADELIYDLQKKRIFANGNILIKLEDGSIQTAKTVELSEDLTQGIATQFYLKTSENSMVKADYAIRHGKNSSQFINAFYSVCKPDFTNIKTPRFFWSLKADKVTQDPDNKMIYYKNAHLDVLGFPVFYTPFFAHADPTSKRHSGLLAPKIGFSKKTGFLYQQPYYFAFSPYQDLTLSPQFTSRINPIIFANYRKRFYSGYLNIDGSLTYEKEFDNHGQKFNQNKIRGHVFSNGFFQISPNWQWGYGLAQTSDDYYLLRYDIAEPFFENLPFQSEHKQLLDQAFIRYTDQNSFFRIALLNYKSLLDQVSDKSMPKITPLIDFKHRLKDPFLSGTLSINANIVLLNRLEGADYFRTSAGFKWKKNYITNQGIILTPAIETRTDLYRIGDADQLASSEKFFLRNLGYLSLTTRWPLYKSGKQVQWLIEPIAQILGAIGDTDLKKTQSKTYQLEHIFNETSLGLDLDMSNLFQHNRYTGYDRIDINSRFVAGVKTQLSLDQKMNATLFLGQSYSFDTPIDYSASSGLQDKISDFVGNLNIDYNKTFYLNTRFRINTKDLSLNRFEGNLNYSGNYLDLRVNYLKFSERFSNIGKQEEFNGNFGFKPFKNWSLHYGVLYDVDHSLLRKQEIKLVYTNQCTQIEFVYSHDETGLFVRDQNNQLRNIGGSDSFAIRFTLATLGGYHSK